MNIIGMLPSEIEKLKASTPSPALENELLAAINKLLSSEAAVDEAVFLAARNLTKAGLMTFVTPQKLAGAIDDPASPASQEFLTGLDQEYAGKVALELWKLASAPVQEVAVAGAGGRVRKLHVPLGGMVVARDLVAGVLQRGRVYRGLRKSEGWNEGDLETVIYEEESPEHGYWQYTR